MLWTSFLYNAQPSVLSAQPASQDPDRRDAIHGMMMMIIIIFIIISSSSSFALIDATPIRDVDEHDSETRCHDSRSFMAAYGVRATVSLCLTVGSFRGRMVVGMVHLCYLFTVQCSSPRAQGPGPIMANKLAGFLSKTEFKTE